MGVLVGTPVANSSGNQANANAVATLPAVPGRTTCLATVQFTVGGATAGALVVATITGVVGGPLSYVFGVPTGATVPAAPLTLAFDPPLVAAAVNTPIVCTLPALGAGNTNAATSATGFQI